MALRPQTPDQKSDAKAAQQDVFLREVDDALREDQFFDVLRRYGLPILAAVVAGLLGLAGYLWWGHSQERKAGETGEQLVKALDSLEAGNLGAADKQLAPIAKDGGGASAIAAKLVTAGIALEQGRSEQAAKTFAEVAADESAPKPYRDLATVREMAVRFDSLEPQKVIDRLKPLAVPGNAWFGPAGELLGLAYLKQGRNDLAGPIFAKIARDEKAPESLRSRARQMAGLLGVDAIDDPGKAAGIQPDDAAAAPPS